MRRRVWDGKVICESCKHFMGRKNPTWQRAIICLKGKEIIHTIMCAEYEEGEKRVSEK